MNLLMISGDTSLAMDDKEKVIGDTKKRHVLYGKYLSQIHIVVFSRKEQNLSARKLSENVVVYPTSSRKFFALWDAYRIAKNICQENKIDMVTVQSPFLYPLVGYMLKKRLGIPFNVQLIGGECLDNRFWLNESKINYLYNAQGKFFTKRADSVRVISKRLENYAISDLKISPEKVIYFTMSTNLDTLINKGQDVNIRAKYPAYDHIILFLGRLVKQKNADKLLEIAPIVLKRFPSALFLIVGDGPEKAKVENIARRLNITGNVQFEGQATYDLVASYYRACTIFVFPSDYEGWGRVAIEALACGKPVIMTETGCAGEIVVDGETGCVVPPGSADLLAQKIIYLLENPEIRQRMGKAGLEYVRKAQNGNKDGQKWLELCTRTVELARRR